MLLPLMAYHSYAAAVSVLIVAGIFAVSFLCDYKQIENVKHLHCFGHV